jgi:hypothetical protein
MTDDLVKRLRDVFADTPEILSWIDASTYEGAEIRTHVAGMFEAMLLAANRIEHLESANLKQSLIMVGHLSRIEELEAALREIIGALDDPKGGQHVYDMRNASYIARKTLEGKDGE